MNEPNYIQKEFAKAVKLIINGYRKSLIEQVKKMNLSELYKKDSFRNWVTCGEEVRSDFLSLLEQEGVK